MIPFNRPHGLRIIEWNDFHIKTLIPYRRKNFNHIRGLHACALATLSEFTTGFLLLNGLEAARYRIIMQRMEVSYHYQGKTDATAEFSISKEWIEEHVAKPLLSSDAIVVPCEVKITDTNGNQLTTGLVYWQIKEWGKVRTKT